MTFDGGGWTLRAAVALGATSTTGLVVPSSNAYVEAERFAVLRANASAFRARGPMSGATFFATVAEAASGNCHGLNTPVPETASGSYRWSTGTRRPAAATSRGSTGRSSA